MKNNKIIKTLALAACAILLVVGSVAGTLAYLKDTSTVKNTFTVGNISIKMDEAKTDAYGVSSGTRNDEGVGNAYKLIPGHTYVKDPTIYIEANSEACYLFVKVVNGIEAIEADGNKIADQLTTGGWKKLAGVDNVYYFQEVINSSSTEQKRIVFEKFTIASNANVAAYKDEVIEVTAYAIQADGVVGDTFEAKVANAWTNGQFN